MRRILIVSLLPIATLFYQCNGDPTEETIEGAEDIVDEDFRDNEADTVDVIQDLGSESNERGMEETESKEDLEDVVDKDSIDS